MAMDQLQEKGIALFEGGREPLITSVSFGQKDGMLCEWVQSIPKGTFSMVVRDVIKAHLLEQEYAFPIFPHKEQVIKKTVTKSLSIGKDDFEVYQFIVSIQKFGRANEIKKLLWKYWKQDNDSVKRHTGRQHSKSHRSNPITVKGSTNASNTLEDALFSIAADMNGKK